MLEQPRFVRTLAVIQCRQFRGAGWIALKQLAVVSLHDIEVAEQIGRECCAIVVPKEAGEPLHGAPVSLATQDRWLQIAAYRAWRDPRVKLLTQYHWYDEPLARLHTQFAGWQSGLRFVDGRPKPALAHFDTPMYLDKARSLLWGQARPGGAQAVRVERRKRGAKLYAPYATVRTDARGYWTLKRRLARGASYRFRTATATSASVRR